MNINIIKKNNVLFLLAFCGVSFEKTSYGAAGRIAQMAKNNKMATGTLATLLGLLLAGGAYSRYGASTHEEIKQQVEELKEKVKTEENEAVGKAAQALQLSEEAKQAALKAEQAREIAKVLAYYEQLDGAATIG